MATDSATPWIDSFLRTARVARMATVRADGAPHAVPICYAYDGEFFYSAIDAKPKRRPPEQLQRIRNLRADPRVCLVIDEYDDAWSRLRYVLVHGEAEILDSGAEHAHALRLLREKYPPYRTMPLEQSLMLKITPKRFT